MNSTVLASPPSWRLLRFAGRPRVAWLALAAYALVALLAPWWAGDPAALNVTARLRPPSEAAWFGTDQLGRDIFARTLVGTRVSLVVGLSVAASATAIGLAIGLAAGYFRRLDNVLMRINDGLMAIPGILLAIALVAVLGSTVLNVVVAIMIPEVPRMARLVRSVVLTVRDYAYVDAAVTLCTPVHRILWRHILPSTVGPLTVQATYICASAIITESVLSFIGAGVPASVVSWGNMMADGRQLFEIAPWVIFFPAVALSGLVLLVNLLGDTLRERLDPRLSRRVMS